MQKQIKIVFFLSWNPYYYSSASSNRWLTYINSFISAGVSVTLVISNGFFSIAEEKDYLNGEKKEKAKTIYYTTHRQYSGFNRKINRIKKMIPFVDIAEAIKLKRILRKENPDFILLSRYETYCYGMNKLIREGNYRFVLEASEFEDIDRPNSRLRIIGYNKRIERFYSVLSHISLFTVMTKTLCRHFEELTNHKGNIIHVPMTVDLSRFDRSKLKTEKLPDLPSPYIAYCGSLSNRKDGIDILIQSFSEFHKRFPQYHLCLAGANHPDVDGQKKQIVSLCLEDHVHYLGVLNQSEIPAFLCNASVLALARPKSHQAEGGFPTKLGEYLATGNPVCVTKTGEIADYLRDGESAFLAEPDSVESFTDALCRVASDFKVAETVGSRGRGVAEESFNMNIHIKRLLERLKSLG